MNVSPYKLASVLLQYPTMALYGGISHLDTAARSSPRASQEAFSMFLSWLRDTTPADAAQHYVATFDLRRRCALYLTYYRHGDTRNRLPGRRIRAQRGGAARLPAAGAGIRRAVPRGEKLLRAHRADLELLRRALDQAGTPYVSVVEAVCAHLLRPGRRDLALIRSAWENGPPAEQVGLEPFAPPEYLAGPGAGGDRGQRRGGQPQRRGAGSPRRLARSPPSWSSAASSCWPTGGCSSPGSGPPPARWTGWR